ncbi:unnamed protein product [Clavelina lepadiformis]|uniref:Uncharacterized protein n=1 Tax=Clavelina lepadiformis TaxID=159417 RepID=A0ABP0H0D0_CLALP
MNLHVTVGSATSMGKFSWDNNKNVISGVQTARVEKVEITKPISHFPDITVKKRDRATKLATEKLLENEAGTRKRNLTALH